MNTIFLFFLTLAFTFNCLAVEHWPFPCDKRVYDTQYGDWINSAVICAQDEHELNKKINTQPDVLVPEGEPTYTIEKKSEWMAPTVCTKKASYKKIAQPVSVSKITVVGKKKVCVVVSSN